MECAASVFNTYPPRLPGCALQIKATPSLPSTHTFAYLLCHYCHGGSFSTEWDVQVNIFHLIWLALALLSICIIIVDGRQRGSKEKLVYMWIIILPFSSLEFKLTSSCSVYLSWVLIRVLKSRGFIPDHSVPLLEALNNAAKEEERKVQ